MCYSLFYSLSDPCENVNCNHGTCTSDGGRAHCECNSDYTGNSCDERELNCTLPCSLALVYLSVAPTAAEQINLAPEIMTHPTSVKVRLFQGANMTCRATGYPVPDINWFKDSETITKFKNRQQITFNQVDLGDRGFYHCEASNSVGTKISSKVLLTISGMQHSLSIIIINYSFSTIADVIQYRAVFDLSSSARRRRQSSIDNTMLDSVIEQVSNFVLVKTK